ncbi:dCTP deaminase domain-containing protein [Bradyrhizobium sp. USDA 4471]
MSPPSDKQSPTSGETDPPTFLAEVEFADSEDVAETRSARYRGPGKDIDPFPDIPRALLSSEHVKAYVRQAGMIHPFAEGHLKSASYEVSAGGRFIYWDEDGKKISRPVAKDGTITLPPNSISFVQIGITFRLPQYIAVRFNLRITHVHRGLLLGTGPLVDPGFHGKLLIPLHNLTSDEYTIRGDEGLIWMEFTKTSHKAKEGVVRNQVEEKFEATEARKNDQPPEYYFDRASKNRPIRSSIPGVVAEARSQAKEAVDAASRAERTNRIFVGGGLLAVAGLVIGLFSFFESVKANVIAAYSLASSVSAVATQAGADAKKAQDDIKDLRTTVDAIGAKGTTEELQRVRSQLEDTRVEVQVLRREIDRLIQRTGPETKGSDAK